MTIGSTHLEGIDPCSQSHEGALAKSTGQYLETSFYVISGKVTDLEVHILKKVVVRNTVLHKQRSI